MSQRIGASKSKLKHPLIDYILRITGVVLMQENNYLSSPPLSLPLFFLLFSKAIWPCPFILRRWLRRRKDAEREKIEERKNGKREGFTGFRKLTAWQKVSDHYNSSKVPAVEKKTLCYFEAVDREVKSYLSSSQLKKKSLTLVHTGYLMNLKRFL